MQALIDESIRTDVLAKLNELAQQHQVTIINAIESGSRAWGFPSPDSDYDVRFIYAHQPEWYIQLTPERDVIELPVSAVLDIGGWDLRKAMQLANNGNTVIQEWMISPLVYQQHRDLADRLRAMVASTFNAKASFHHYASMAKSMLALLDEPNIKLKKFFYISRATLSAWWIAREQTMPTIVFSDLVHGLTDNQELIEAFQHQIQEKATKTEAEIGEIDPMCLEFIRKTYQELMAVDTNALPPRQRGLENEDLRHYLIGNWRS